MKIEIARLRSQIIRLYLYRRNDILSRYHISIVIICLPLVRSARDNDMVNILFFLIDSQRKTRPTHTENAICRCPITQKSTQRIFLYSIQMGLGVTIRATK